VEFPESMALCHPFFIRDGDVEIPLPEWAKAEIWLGWWCRRLQLERDRLVVTAVLPDRNLAAAFAGLGCLLAGAQLFQSGLTWDIFRALPKGTEIFWRERGSQKRYEGSILEQNGWPADTVPVQIIKGRRRSDVGSTFGFSRNWFNDCIFSEERLPAENRSKAMDSALGLHRSLGLETNPRWIWTAGAEGRILTSQSRFHEALMGLRIGVQGSDPVLLGDALCMASDNDKTLAKLRLTSVSHVPEQGAPVTILDGGRAFDRIRQIESGNILMLLERTEYTAEIHNLLLDLRNVDKTSPSDILPDVPSRFPPGMELAAFVVPWGQ